MELNNYRPISVLNIFSNVFKRLVYDRLTQFLDKYNILYHNQIGFRQYHSTHHALITLFNKITKSLDRGDIVIGVFLDFKKLLIQLIIPFYYKIYISMVYAET